MNNSITFSAINPIDIASSDTEGTTALYMGEFDYEAAGEIIVGEKKRTKRPVLKHTEAKTRERLKTWGLR